MMKTRDKGNEGISFILSLSLTLSLSVNVIKRYGPLHRMLPPHDKPT